jgi:hypothetical protein
VKDDNAFGGKHGNEATTFPIKISHKVPLQSRRFIPQQQSERHVIPNGTPV